MRINKISDKIDVLVFSQEKGLDINITVIYINDHEAILIDTGYLKQGIQVKKYLEEKKVSLKEIILSHYHPDHAAGINAFNQPKVSASYLYKSNFLKCTNEWDKDHDYKEPTDLIYDGDSRDFGSIQIKFYQAPGHSVCSLLIEINKDTLYIGDLMMKSPDGKPTLPYLTPGGTFKEHISSLKKIKELSPKRLLLSHGDPIVGKQAIDEAVDKRMHYLETMLKTKGECSLEEALLGDKDDWAYKGWHRYNLMYI